jgi:hypothetical protein
MKKFLLVFMFVLMGCNIPLGDGCNAKDLAPYPDDLLEGCNNKCCVWELLDFDTGIICEETWCFKDCSWDLMNETCYQT